MNKYNNLGIDESGIKGSLKSLQSNIKSTQNKNGTTGWFASIYDLNAIKNYNHPILLASTDGVGTKVKIAEKFNILDNIGIDLVAMCANDIIAQGGKPEIFLDYYASSLFNKNQFEAIVNSIVKGCKIAGCSLLGGETAIMPGIYNNNEFDIAGFCIGFGEKSDIFYFDNIKPGDCLIGLKSSGVHSNGYSLINDIISKEKSIDDNIIEQLMVPTCIYHDLNQYTCLLKAACHITGGGFHENISRVLSDNISFEIDFKKINILDIFKWIKEKSGMSWDDMYDVYNCGIGMVLICDENNKNHLLSSLSHYEAIEIGKIIKK